MPFIVQDILKLGETRSTVLGDDFTIKFFALKSAVISDSKISKHQDDVLNFRILEELKRNSGLSQKELAKKLGCLFPRFIER